MKKIVILLLVSLLIFGGLVYADSDDIEKQEELLEEIQNQLETLDDSHQDLGNQKNAVVRNIRSLEESVRTTEDEIVVLNGDIADNQVQVGIATLELGAAEQDLQDTNEMLDSRIRVMYMNGTVGYLEVILEAKNFEDLLVRIEMLQRIITSDTDLIAQMEINKQTVNEKKESLETEQIKLVDLQNEMQVKQAELRLRINEFEVEKDAINNDMVALAEQIDDTRRDADAIKNIIKELELSAKYVGGVMTWPVPSKKTVNSYFGPRIHPILKVNKLHTGIDIPANTGTRVVAAQGGKVVWSNWLGSYGKCIMIDHGGGIVTVYAHNSSLIVKKGAQVSKGQNIALSGNTGNSTGPHVHFEVRVNGEYVDPFNDWIGTTSEF